MRLKSLFLIVFLTASTRSFSQVYNYPATGLFTPETMEVIKAENTPQYLKLFLSVENRISGGSFCADKNIFVILPDGSRLKMQNSAGIPRCPDTYRFKNIGEKLSFALTFPGVKKDVKWFDVIEDCNDNCFRIYGILLDNDLTARINKALSLVDEKQPDRAIEAYKNLLDNLDQSYAGISSSLYNDLITLLAGKGYNAQASEWYKKLQSSDFPKKELYIKNLNSRGIKY